MGDVAGDGSTPSDVMAEGADGTLEGADTGDATGTRDTRPPKSSSEGCGVVGSREEDRVGPRSGVSELLLLEDVEEFEPFPVDDVSGSFVVVGWQMINLLLPFPFPL